MPAILAAFSDEASAAAWVFSTSQAVIVFCWPSAADARSRSALAHRHKPKHAASPSRPAPLMIDRMSMAYTGRLFFGLNVGPMSRAERGVEKRG